MLFCDDNARFEAVQRLMQQQRQLLDRQRGLEASKDAAQQQHADALTKHDECMRQAESAAAQVRIVHESIFHRIKI